MTIAFRQQATVQYGVTETITPCVRRIVANNPGPFTYHGTGTYVLGRGNVAIVDPGPLSVAHVEALLAALDGERITHQLITHTHLDHSPAARLVRERTGAQTYGFGPHGQGRYERGARVEAGADTDFVPDTTLRSGDEVEGDGWSVRAVHTPGHCSNHLCFALAQDRILLTGDHVMGWSTSVVSPPDGDMRDYVQSLELLLEREDDIYLPTHGPAIDDPKPFVRSLIEHRRQREQQIMQCLVQGIDRISAMVPRMYQSTPAVLHPAAARSVFSHMLDLLERGWVACEDDPPTLDARYLTR